MAYTVVQSSMGISIYMYNLTGYWSV